MGLFSSLFGKKEKVDLGQLISDGALILDVRTPSEFAQGTCQRSQKYSVRQAPCKYCQII
jgi:rhodanese-related sulfurtransferase